MSTVIIITEFDFMKQ